MIQAYANIPFAWDIYRQSRQSTKPRLIWLHSITRWIGWMPLLFLAPNDQIVITYHDMGRFHPRASRVYSE